MWTSRAVIVAVSTLFLLVGVEGGELPAQRARRANQKVKKGPTGRNEALSKEDMRRHATYAVTELEVDKLHFPDFCTEKTKIGDKVAIRYTGRLINGKLFDNNLENETPFEFTIGQGTVIRGWDEGLLDMCVEEKRLLRVPPSKAYGQAGLPPKIPRGATLVFEAELVKIN
mmetsp:Transcript_32021/g.90871  ORF Transcript_32021/g.90871 Transcript_32021/m.90871 type:complete len:171 (-) Transcript_32021:327-839(-)|eukprot:CAMPEP_0117673926 /NCGR_PEP_ID=MMETSP0804-20121206/14752_1 /TAXON_ID=1074897 /ORGANISM="Tetraselmis astigmatica, Strain CCMP880" /LENGTH=170 /DNA_ID=CAMNT_0005482735 /DNA_START=87 /DNA_END=599 /DNA_ORIENTATION=+